MSEIKRIQGMVRSIDQWRNMVPSVVATGSMAQVEYALVDAKTDIEALWLKVAALSSAAVAEREPVYDESEFLTIAYMRGAMDAKRDATSELEAENARLRAAISAVRDDAMRADSELCSMEVRAEAAEARLAEALKALEPFAAIEWDDEDGWSHDSPYRERVCDWFGPSDFRTARRVREGGKS